MALRTPGPRFATQQGSVTLDPRLIDTLQTAAGAFGLDVQFFSGVQGRSTGTKNHPGGYAVDVKLFKDGVELPNYQSPATFAAYERFAQIARAVQVEKYPELSDKFRWGGYFASGKNPMDLMHFDVNPHYARDKASGGAMAGGSWSRGVDPRFAKRWGITESNPGLGTPEGQRVAGMVRQHIAGGPTPPADIPGGSIASAYFTSPRQKPAALSAIDAAAGPSSAARAPADRFAAVGSGAASFGVGKLGATDSQPMPSERLMTVAAQHAQRGDGMLADPRIGALLGPKADPVVAPPRQQTLNEQMLARLAQRPAAAPAPAPAAPGVIRSRDIPASLIDRSVTSAQIASGPAAGGFDDIGNGPGGFADLMALAGKPVLAGGGNPQRPAVAPRPMPAPGPVSKPSSHAKETVGGESYKIQAGDTLGAIALRSGHTVDELRQLNGISDPNRITAGQTLKLRGAAAAPPVPRQRPLDVAPAASAPVVTLASSKPAGAPGGGGLFSVIGNAFASGAGKLDGMTGGALSSTASRAANAAAGVAAGAPQFAKNAQDDVTKAILSSLAGRTAFIDPMVAKIGNPSGGSVGSSRSDSAPAAGATSFKGTSTGQTYNVGQQYKTGDGRTVTAQANGTFK